MSLRKFVAVMPQEFNNSLNDETKHEKLRTKNFDKAMRWSMTFVGLLSGKASLVENKYLQKLVIVYHFVVCCLMTATSVCAMVAYLPAIQTDLKSTLQVLMALFFTFQVSACSWIFFILCHRRSGFSKYYMDLQEHVELCSKAGLQVDSLTFRLLRYGTAISSWFIAFLLIGIHTYIVSATTDVWESPLSAFLNITFFWATIHWSMQTAYIATVSQTLWQLGHAFNSKFKEETTKSCHRTLEHLESYREVHLRWCQLVATANKSLRFIIAVTIICSMTTGLIILYLMANEKFSFATTLQHVTLLLTILGSIAVIVFFADQMGNMTGGVYDDLICLYRPDIDINIHRLYQMQLFLSRVERPEEFSVGGLMAVNKEFGLTILGVMVTYYIVLQQAAPQGM